MFGLTIVLLGQAVSILASSMTGFALSVWVFQQTSSATSLGIMQTMLTLFYLADHSAGRRDGDRYNRKLMMAVSDLAAGLGTLAILFLLTTGNLEIWHFYLVNAIIGLGNASPVARLFRRHHHHGAQGAAWQGYGMMSFVQADRGWRRRWRVPLL